MDREGFRLFLQRVTLGNGCQYTNNAINSRVSKAAKVERVLELDLDDVVQSEEKTWDVGRMIYDDFPSKPGNYYNAVTRYFWFRNGYEIGRRIRRSHEIGEE